MATARAPIHRTLEQFLAQIPRLEDMRASSLPAKFVQYQDEVMSALRYADPTDETGFVGAFLSAANYAQFLTDLSMPAIAYALREPPEELPAAATAEQVALYRFAQDDYLREAHALRAFQLAIHLSLPLHIQRQFRSAAGTVSYGTPQQQWAKLGTAVGHLTSAHLDAEHRPLDAPYRVGMPLVDLFDIHDSGHSFRAQVKQPYSQRDRVSLLVAALIPCGLFTLTLRRFRELHPTLADQHYDALKALVLAEADEDLAHTKASLSTASAVDSSLHRDLAALRAEVAALKAAASPRPTTQWNPTAKHFCWTCGTQSGHPSFKCPTPAAGHVRSATRRDKQGSKVM